MLLRKSAVVALCLALGAGSASAQFTATTLDLGPVIGLGTGSGGGMSIGGKIEKAIKELPNLGNGILGIDAFVQRWSNDCEGFCDASVIFLGARANYHFVIKSNPKIDPFIGLGLGYNKWSFGDDDTPFGDFGGDEIEFVGNVGIRYYFSEKLAGYADLGTGAATINLGVMFKLK